MRDLLDFLSPSLPELDEENGYTDGQYAKHMSIFVTDFPDLSEVDIILVGVNDMRGAGIPSTTGNAAMAIRNEFYRLHYWYPDIKITRYRGCENRIILSDTHAALKTVLQEMLRLGKPVVVIGGSHDLTLAQYEACGLQHMVIDATGIDARINPEGRKPDTVKISLLDMLTSEPNMVRHYSHIAFQSYFKTPHA